MRIGIYADTAKDAEPRGIGFYVVNLINAMARQGGGHEYYLYYRRDVTAVDPGLPRITTASNIVRRAIRYPRLLLDRYPRLWWDHYLPRCIRGDKLDVFHGPNFFLPVLRGIKTLLTIHDLAFFRMDLYPPGLTAAYKKWTLTSIERASRIVAISENTRKDILSLGVDESRIDLVYSGGGNFIASEDIPAFSVEQLLSDLRLSPPYVLFVGTLHPRKNVPFLLHAFAALKRKGFPHKLVLAGKRDSGSDEIEQVSKSLGIASDVLITGYLDDLTVRALYEKAALFVLPSRYEGFGMIVQEAMMYGVPVIAANTSALPEVVGDGGLLVELDDIVGLTKAMHRVLSDAEYRLAMIERGRAQARRFTWEKCAGEMLGLYGSMVACA